MIITIDGPAASGKSTVARLLAEKYHYYYLNSGYLYRAIAYILQDTEVNVQELHDKLHKLIYNYTAQEGPTLIYKQEAITSLLKDPKIDTLASLLAQKSAVREAIVQYQQKLADHKSLIAEGRDCGTVVFPHADYKFFLTANISIRAQRWQKYQQTKGTLVSLDESKAFMQERDHRDRTRPIAPLIPACDALIVDTSDYTIDQVLALLDTLINP